MDILQLLCYLSDFGEAGSMWWELIPNTLKQVEQQLLHRNSTHTSTCLSDFTHGRGMDQAY